MESTTSGVGTPRFGTTAQLIAAARALSTEEEFEAFIAAALRNEIGKEFLGSPEWVTIQRELAGKLLQPGPAVDDGAVWDSWIDRMVKLPTVKMAHEFLCRLQVEPLGRRFLEAAPWTSWCRARFPEMDPRTGAMGPVPVAPQVGDSVLYVSFGTPGGEYGREERAAKVTAVGGWVDVEVTGELSRRPVAGALRRVVQVWDALVVSLFVMNPDGTFHNKAVRYDDGEFVMPDDAAARGLAGDVIAGKVYRGGTWHWPRPQALAMHIPSPVSANCGEHGSSCKTWVPTLTGGTHVGG